MHGANQRIVIHPHEGAAVALGGVGVIYKVAGDETGGRLAIVEHPVEPGTLVPPHTHTREDELSYVLEGRLGVRVGDQTLEAGPGTYVFKPRGVPHTFWNAGPAPARLVEIITPAGFESYFAEMSALLAAGGPPDLAQIAAIAERYGLTYGPDDWIPELAASYHLRPPGR